MTGRSLNWWCQQLLRVVRGRPGDAFKVRELAGTLVAGPEEAMRTGSIRLTPLEQARSFEVIDRRLTLCGDEGSDSLVFEALDE